MGIEKEPLSLGGMGLLRTIIWILLAPLFFFYSFTHSFPFSFYSYTQPPPPPILLPNFTSSTFPSILFFWLAKRSTVLSPTLVHWPTFFHEGSTFRSAWPGLLECHICDKKELQKIFKGRLSHWFTWSPFLGFLFFMGSLYFTIILKKKKNPHHRY